MDKENIASTLNDYLEGSGRFVVEITLSGDNLIQITLDGDARVSIEDCIEVTRYLESRYDREKEDYELRVTTFGIDNPIRMIRQLRKVVGDEVLVKKREAEKEERVRLEKLEEGTLQVTHRIKKGGPKAKALVFKDGEKEALLFEDLEYVKEIICF
ncbi:MAG: hypothetical protein CSA95_05520 [Bacteroidetes bacterium]|nr:MAG: hypothetical protein CSA95_05520 [Bacteroidota bacterium]PIE87737.1 MAG: hypothetical protein CSA04_05445 [Bacteroidota bacterium]